MSEPEFLQGYTVFFDPKDFPGLWVVRGWQMLPGGTLVHSPVAQTADSLEAIRKHIPPGKVRIPRFETDSPSIREVWL